MYPSYVILRERKRPKNLDTTADQDRGAGYLLPGDLGVSPNFQISPKIGGQGVDTT